jgi:hypothetical protein
MPGSAGRSASVRAALSVGLASLAFVAAPALAQPSGRLLQGAAACQARVGKAGRKFKKSILKAWEQCLDEILLGKDCDFAKVSQSIARAEVNFAPEIVRPCTPQVILSPPPDGVGFPANCNFEPGFEPGPFQPAEARCQSLSVFDARSLADCLTCWKEAELNELLKILYPCLVNQLPASSDLDCGTPPAGCLPDRTAAGCSAVIAKAGIVFFLAEDKALEACLDEVRNGKITGPCPDATARARITAAEQRKQARIQTCTTPPPWWDVCPEDSNPPCDKRIASVSDIANCVDSAAEAILDEAICEQYPRAAADGINCPGPEPFCGDGRVNQPSEQCDPPFSLCPGGGFCKPDCTCPSCGDGVVNQPSEQCDPPGVSCGPGKTCNSDCTCPSSCLNPTLIPADGGTFAGTNSGTSTLGGSCGFSQFSPEQVFQWTPAVSGTATIETCGGTTNYDTVLYVRRGDCLQGPEIGCSEFSCGLGTELNPSVTAGQTYFIVVDGFDGFAGNFTLTVVPPRFCGDGLVTPPEQCDPPGATQCPDSQACSASCTCPPPICGNGIVTSPEQCDPPGAIQCPDSQACNADCTCPAPICGNGVVTPPEQCDPPGSLTCPGGKACGQNCTCAPSPCDSGTDPCSGDPWVVCQADQHSAWISQATSLGGHYHPLRICQDLGYTAVSQFGGDCGDVCNFCQHSGSCSNPGLQHFEGGNSCTGQSDACGPLLCFTVQWLCTSSPSGAFLDVTDSLP